MTLRQENGSSLEVSVVLLAGGSGKRMGVSSAQLYRSCFNDMPDSCQSKHLCQVLILCSVLINGTMGSEAKEEIFAHCIMEKLGNELNVQLLLMTILRLCCYRPQYQNSTLSWLGNPLPCTAYKFSPACPK